MTAKVELEACPFCGGRAITHRNSGLAQWAVSCTQCDCKPLNHCAKTEAEANAAWNTRPAAEYGRVHTDGSRSGGQRPNDTALAAACVTPVDDNAACVSPAPVGDTQSARAVVMPGFQAEVHDWMLECFGPEIAADQLERADRFTEEALELAQTATGFTAERAHALVDYVFGRPVGERGQEVGGVMVTLAALCNPVGLSISKEAERELARVWTKVDAIRAKQAAKPTGSALPVAQPAGDVTGLAALLQTMDRLLTGGGNIPFGAIAGQAAATITRLTAEAERWFNSYNIAFDQAMKNGSGLAAVTAQRDELRTAIGDSDLVPQGEHAKALLKLVEQAARIAELERTVDKCRQQFNLYANLHAAKGPEGFRKEQTNRAMVLFCDDALALKETPDVSA